MNPLPFQTEYQMFSKVCPHCRGQTIDLAYQEFLKTHQLTHATYDFLCSLTQENRLWVPSRQTLIQLLVPYYSLNDEHIETIAKGYHLDLTRVSNMYNTMTPEL